MTTISSILDEKAQTLDDKIEYINKLQQSNTNSNCITQSLNILLSSYKETKEKSNI